MTKIYIKNCSECKDCLTQRTPTLDSFEYALDYYCHNKTLKEHKLIEAYVDWNETLKPVPIWCPRRIRK